MFHEDDLTQAEIETWIRKFRYDPEFSCHRWIRVPTVPIRCLCEFAGVPRSNLYAVLRGDLNLTANHRHRLSVAIRAVWAGLRWQRISKTEIVMIDPTRWQRMPKYERQRKSA